MILKRNKILKKKIIIEIIITWSELTLQSRRMSPSATDCLGWERSHRTCPSASPRPGCAWCRRRTRCTRRGAVSSRPPPASRSCKQSVHSDVAVLSSKRWAAQITGGGPAAASYCGLNLISSTHSSASFLIPSHSLIFFCLVPFWVSHLQIQHAADLTMIIYY